eukprot:6207694-Pleurochrysis_carterae.AAC.11
MAAPALSWLIGDEETFLKKKWQIAPLHVRRGDTEYYARDRRGVPLRCSLFDRKLLLSILPLRCQENMRVVRTVAASQDGKILSSGARNAKARFVADKREHAPLPKHAMATRAWTSQRMQEGYTVQLFSPQRHCPRLAALVSALETRFGCLVGCSAYLTPPGCQGLAPHHDDVCVFILQTEGSKHWRVYEPLDGHALPRTPSNDLPRNRLGRCLLQVTLQQGDLLYLPRGFVHEAAADNSFSTHLTLSTYQRFSWSGLGQLFSV